MMYQENSAIRLRRPRARVARGGAWALNALYHASFTLGLLVALMACGDGGAGPSPTDDTTADANNAPDDDAPDNANNTPDDANNAPSNNRAPILTRIGDRRARLGQTLSITLTGEDPDGDELTFLVFGDLPEGAKFDKEASIFTWSPTLEQVGQLALLTFAASDGELEDRETIQISVVEDTDNAAPELTDPGDQVLQPATAFELRLEATDPDGDPIVFSIDGPSPNGSALDSDTGLFTWTPGTQDAGANIRVIFVADDGDARDDVRVRLVVSEQTLRLDDIPPQQVRLGETLTLPLPLDNPGMIPLTCDTLGATLPGSDFDTGTCTFTWTPTDAALVNTTTEFAFQVGFEQNGEAARFIATASVTVLPAVGPTDDLCEADFLEPNDVLNEATPVEDTPLELDALSLCQGDTDYFAIDLVAGRGVRVEIFFEHERGDIDLLLLRGDNGEEVAASANSVTDNELLELAEPLVPGRHYIVVVNYDDSETSYDLRVERVDAPACRNDAHEPDNVRADAFPIDAPYSGVHTICPADVDFFTVNLFQGAMLRTTAFFDEGQDLDLSIIGPDDSSWSSAGLDAVEEVIIADAPVSGEYLIKINGFGDDTSEYILEVITDGPAICEPDLYEPNNDRFFSFPLAPDDFFLTDLTLCGDADWFTFPVEADEELTVYVSGDDLRQTRLRLLDEDGVTLLSQSIDGDDQEATLPALGVSRDVFIVVDSALGVSYDLELLLIPGN